MSPEIVDPPVDGSKHDSPSRAFMNAVIRARRALGYSQTDLANAAGWNFQRVAKLERGRNYLRYDDAHQLAKLLDIDITDPDSSWRTR